MTSSQPSLSSALRRLFSGVKPQHILQKASFPLALAMLAACLGLYLAFMGPYFVWPHWSAMVFPPIILASFSLALFFLGGVFGSLSAYLLFSFLLLEIVLACLTGALSNDLICASSNLPTRMFQFYIPTLIWTGAGGIFIFLTRRFFRRSLKSSAFLFLFAGLLFGVNLFFSFNNDHIKLRLHLLPAPALGIANGKKPLLPLSTPNVPSQIAYEIRHSTPGPLGDMLAMIGFSADPGADNLPRMPHEIPATLHPDPTHQQKNIILIMGEASSAEHYHAYGYGVPTTPLIDHEIAQHAACLIPHAHSAANQTRLAVLPSVSLWKPEDANSGMLLLNLIELAKKQGYKTYWASTQSERGPYSGAIGYIAKYADYFIDPETVSFSFNGKNWHLPQQDEALLPLFDAFSQDSGDRKFILLHLWGSHLPYGSKVRPEDKKALPKASTYDQSIHRTDRLLGEILQTARKNLNNPLIFYVSDHGEDLTSNGGHGLYYGGRDYTIPVLLFGKAAEENCAYLETLRAENGWYSSNMDKFLLLRLLGMAADKQMTAQEKNPDLIAHVGGEIFPWGKLPKQKPLTPLSSERLEK